MDSKKDHKKTTKQKLSKTLIRKRNLLSLFTIILSIILLILLFRMDIIPFKYNIIITTILLLLNILGIVLINLDKHIIIKSIGAFLVVIAIVSNIFGIYYLNVTNSFIDKSFVSNSIYSKNTYYIVSKKNNNLQNKEVTGIISTYSEMPSLKKALERLNDKYTITEKREEDLGQLFQNINDNITQYMLIEKSSYEIVFSIDTALNRDEYEIIDEFDIYTKNKKNNQTDIDKFNIYIGGTDFAGLMDFNMIVSVNTKTHKAVLTSIPRDYYIEVAGKDGRRDKLSFMSAYGAETTKQSLEAAFNTKIDYSILVDTTSLIKIVDYLDGINFCSDYSYTTTHALVNNTYDDRGKKLNVTKGCQHINGIEALTIARERNAFPGRDRVRQENCQKILMAIFKKLVSTDTILHYNETLNTISSLYDTDIPKKVITNIAKDMLNNGNSWDIETQSVDGVDDKDKVHLSNMIDWVMYPDQNTITKASEKINKTLNN